MQNMSYGKNFKKRNIEIVISISQYTPVLNLNQFWDDDIEWPH